MVIKDVKDRIGYITLHRLEKKNALNYSFISEIKSALADWKEESNVSVVVIQSNSDVFCAGADLDYLMSLQGNSFEDNINDTMHIAGLFNEIYTYPKITISLVEGHAIAGGCGIATATDFCYAVPEAKFGYSEVRIGFIPALVSVYLVKKIGEARARELLLTGKLISGEELRQFNMVNELVSKENIRQYVHNMATKIAESTSMQSVRYTKELLVKLHDKSWEDAITLATEYNARMRETDDFKRGIASFVHKEKLSW